jgi:hypothetical protein
MTVTRDGDGVCIELSGTEVHLLRRALERASFIDTPPEEQSPIMAFCARALEALPRR